MGPPEDVSLATADAVVTRIVVGSWNEGHRVGRANLTRFQVTDVSG
jgi:hypothetical protein